MAEPNTDLGELVARLRDDAKQHCDQAKAQLDPDLCAWHVRAADRALNAADALAASNLRAEALEKERDGLKEERRGLLDSIDNWTEAFEGLRARVAEVLEPLCEWVNHIIIAPDDTSLLITGRGICTNAKTIAHFRRAAELHAAVRGERK